MSMMPKDNWLYLPNCNFPVRITTLPGESVGAAIGRIFGSIPAPEVKEANKTDSEKKEDVTKSTE